ncbi:MAG TPA: hypothetical protein VL943_12075 [Niabella sp.]|nr:hypothetical protein [Niabella sp.]
MSKDIFKGIDISEIENLGKRLSLEREADNRFAAIQIKGDRLAEKDITFHKTAFEACKYILMAPTENGYYNIRSLSLLGDDVKRILDGKDMDKESENKMHRGVDRER